MSDANRIDWPTKIGMTLVGVSVAAFSSYSQFETARSAGVPWQLAWVLPMSTDATGFVAARAWMTAVPKTTARRYAATLTLVTVLLSFLAAALHLVGHLDGWFVKGLIGGLPSIVLAALVHLVAVRGKTATARTKPRKTAPSATPKSTGAVAAPRPPAAAPAPQAEVPAPREESNVTPIKAPGWSDDQWTRALELGRAANGEQRDVKVDEIQSGLSIGRAKATRLRQAVLATLAGADDETALAVGEV